MNFSDVRYKEGLNYLLSMQQEKSYHSIYECFFQLIDGIDKDSLSNLITMMLNDDSINIDQTLTASDCYQMLQNKNIDDSYKITIIELAYQCMDSGIHLGSKVNEYGINTSDWIEHSLQEARLCSIMASKCGLDSDKAFKLGLLHDYGRKYDHSFRHPIIGFEKLYDLGYYEEAIGSLTHSFLNGNIFACYSPSKLYTVDNNLNAIPINNEITNNDMYTFLEKYQYTDYDRILNLADLMATSKKVVSPEERILDIESRRKMEGKQREFFLNQLSQSIIWYLNKMGIVSDKYQGLDFKGLSESMYEAILDDSKKDIKKY